MDQGTMCLLREKQGEIKITLHSLRFTSVVRKCIGSCEYILQQDSLHCLRFFKQGTVSRLLECVKAFHGGLYLFKVVLCQRVIDRVIMNAR